MRSILLLFTVPFFFFIHISAFAQITPGSEDNFITIWNTTNYDFITIPTIGEGYNYDLYWEEVDNPENNGFMSKVTGNVTISDLDNQTLYRIEIAGDFPRIYMAESEYPWKLSKIEQWGNIQWSSMEGAFSGSASMNIIAEDVPDLSAVESMRNMFHLCEFLVGEQANWEWNTANVVDMSGLFKLAWNFDQDISSWEVGNVTDMSYMFYGEDDPFGFPRFSRFNQDISSWDVSNVENMRLMFHLATRFNQDLSGWDVSNVTNMSGLFSGASSFNSDLSNWDVSKTLNMAGIFSGASSFNSDLSEWDVSSTRNMFGMFSGASSFNSDLSGWDVSNVTNMARMFTGARLFNSDITGWDVSNVESMADMFSGTLIFNHDISVWDISNVTDMSGMFSYTVSFNQDISVWDIGHVTRLRSMFSGAESFNQDISNWDVSGANDLSFMFSNAYSFNQDISGWDVSNVSDFWMMFNNAFSFNQNLAEWDISSANNMMSMFNNSGMQCENYSATLIGWASQENAPAGVRLGAEGMEFAPSVEQFRNNILIDLKGWEIIGDQEGDCSPVNTVDFADLGIQIRAYPNPVMDFLNLEPTDNLGEVNLIVYDVKGKIIGEYRVDLSNPQTIDVRDWGSGLYFLHFAHDEVSQTLRVVKE